MTETDRLRAALRLCAVVVRRPVLAACPHGTDVDCWADMRCDACRADEVAAALALRAVVPDLAPPVGPASDEVRARALAIVRDAGLGEPEPGNREVVEEFLRANVPDRPDLFPPREIVVEPGMPAADFLREVLAGSRATWSDLISAELPPDPHAAAPGEVLAVAEVEDLRPEYDFSGGVRGKYADRYPGALVEVPAGTPTRCPCCRERNGVAPAFLCPECDAACVIDRWPDRLLHARPCKVSGPALAVPPPPPKSRAPSISILGTGVTYHAGKALPATRGRGDGSHIGEERDHRDGMVVEVRDAIRAQHPDEARVAVAPSPHLVVHRAGPTAFVATLQDVVHSPPGCWCREPIGAGGVDASGRSTLVQAMAGLLADDEAPVDLLAVTLTMPDGSVLQATAEDAEGARLEAKGRAEDGRYCDW